MNRAGIWIGLCLPALTAGGGFLVALAGQADDLERARTAFERHNYKAALELVDRYLASEPQPEAATTEADPTGLNPWTSARLIRGQCLLKLRKWEEGVGELKALLEASEAVARRADVHEALGTVGLQQHRLRHLAVGHFGIAAELHAGKGNNQAAASALIKKAEGFVGLEQWEKLPDLGIPTPDDWRTLRRLQRKFALAALDRAVELAGDSELAIEAFFRKGRLYQRDLHLEFGDLDAALKLFAELVERWPVSRRAPEALYQVARIHETYKEDYVAAAELYHRIIENYGESAWVKRAARGLEHIVTPMLHLAVEGPILPGATGQIHYRCRNVTEVTLQAYRVDLFALIRKVDLLHRLEDWVPQGQPAAAWKLTLPDRGEHKFFDSRAEGRQPTALPVRDPGAYVIVGEGAGGRVRSCTMMVVSRLAAVAKSARSATLVVAADAQSGQPAAGAEVLVQQHLGKQRYRYITDRTDDAGRYRRIHLPDKGKDNRGGESMILVRDGQHYAVCGSSFYWYWWGYGERYRGYCFTDRPVYRPDQVIHFKAVLRGYEQGTYETLPGRRLAMKVYDPRGQVIDQRDLVTGEEGSVSSDIRLPDQAALGIYRIHLTVDGRPIDVGAGARFRVEEYRKPEFEVTVRADRPDYRVGDSIDARIEARYYFGEPVVGASVKCTVHRSRYYPHFRYPTPWPWYFDDLRPRFGGHQAGLTFAPPGYRPWQQYRDLVGTFEIVTDDQGVAVVRLDTEPLPAEPEADLRYDIEAEVTDVSRRVITGSGQIKVTHTPFYIHVQPQRCVYQPGDTVRLEITAKGPNDDPVAVRADCKVYRLIREVRADQADPAADEYRLGDKVFERSLTIDAAGRGQVQWVADEEGPFRVVVLAEPSPEESVIGSADLWIARRGGRYLHYAYRDLELVPDKPSYAVGDTANVLINTRFDSCYVLLTAEGDDLFDDRIVFVKGGTQLIELPITKGHVPNFELTATILRDNKVFQDQVPVIVPPADRFLNVAVKAPGEKFYPREGVELDIAITDSTGRPAPAEVALMMVDASIYYVQPEFRPQIEKHFYGRKRPHLVRTHSSFDLAGTGVGGYRGDWGGIKMGMGDEAPMAMTAKAAPLLLQSEGATEAEFATAQIRKDFPDTVLWAAHVMTGEDGRASVDVELPDTLTTWRVHAVAIDRDTRVGQAATDLITRKDVIVRLETPRFLVEGDQPVLTVIAHNYLPGEKMVQVTLETSEQIKLAQPRVDGRAVRETASGQVLVTVPADGEVAVDFPARAIVPGQATLTARAAADVDADAVQINLPVIPYGADRFLAQSGSIRQSDQVHARTVTMIVPEEVAPHTPLMEIHLNPSIAAVMIDALPYLLRYPYGCTEQTMSRFLPAVVVRRTLQQLGIDLADVRAKIDRQGGPAVARLPKRVRNNPVFNNAVMDDMIRSGLERLAELQNPDGGWGWWAEGSSNPYMTAYVVYGLTEAAAGDVAFERAMLERGVEFLLKRVVSTEPAARYAFAADDDNVRAWMLYALAMHDRSLLNRAGVAEVLERIYEDRDGLSDYCRAMLLITLHRLDRRERTAILVENLYNTVRLDDELNTASWCDRGSYRYWYNNGLEATAMVLRALLAVQPDHDYVPRAVNWLVRNRRGSRWFSTKDTAFAVYALADYLVASGELQADMTIDVTIDGRIKRTFRVTPENVLTFDTQIIVAPEDLQPGEHRLELSRSGKGNLYYAVYLDYFTRQDPIEPAGHEIFITRNYARLVPKQVTKTRDVYDHRKRKYVQETYQAIDYDRRPIEEGDLLASGDLIEVQLAIDAKNNFEYLIFEDPKAAGCEPVELHSGYHRGGGPYVNVELRDKKTAFFATYLPQGKHPLTYRLRCETPGCFHALPARIEAMYSPYVRANSRSDKLEIGEM